MDDLATINRAVKQLPKPGNSIESASPASVIWSSQNHVWFVVQSSLSEASFMFRKFSLALVALIATSQLASAAVWYHPGFGYGGGNGGGFYGGYHSSYYYHYSAPSYRSPVVTYRRVPVYVVVPRPKPVVVVPQVAPDPCACQK